VIDRKLTDFIPDDKNANAGRFTVNHA